jgi:hypothetical protein
MFVKQLVLVNFKIAGILVSKCSKETSIGVEKFWINMDLWLVRLAFTKNSVYVMSSLLAQAITATL